MGPNPRGLFQRPENPHSPSFGRAPAGWSWEPRVVTLGGIVGAAVHSFSAQCSPRSRGARLALFLALLFAACGQKVDREGKPIEIGRLRLRTFPAGARVWIDGELKIEATPATLVLKAGQYHLKLQAPGAEALERIVEIEAGQIEELTLNIPKAPEAKVSVFSDVAGADVRINGYRRGATPLEGVVTKPGVIDVTVTTSDGRAKGLRAELAIGEQKHLEIDFEEIASKVESAAAPTLDCRPPARGFVTLGLKPDGKVYTEDDQLVGETPLTRHPFPPGEHALLLRSLDGRYEKRVVLFVEEDQHAVVRFQLRDEDQVPGWVPPLDAGRTSEPAQR